jgi:hypothetical protein
MSEPRFYVTLSSTVGFSSHCVRPLTPIQFDCSLNLELTFFNSRMSKGISTESFPCREEPCRRSTRFPNAGTRSVEQILFPALRQEVYVVPAPRDDHKTRPFRPAEDLRCSGEPWAGVDRFPHRCYARENTRSTVVFVRRRQRIVILFAPLARLESPRCATSVKSPRGRVCGRCAPEARPKSAAVARHANRPPPASLLLDEMEWRRGRTTIRGRERRSLVQLPRMVFERAQ